MPQEFQLKYGRQELQLSIPIDSPIEVLQFKGLPSLKDPIQAIKVAIRQPIDSPPLKDLVGKGDRVAILVSDFTRTTKAELFLPILLNELNQSGVDDSAIFIIFAVGSHRKHTKEEQLKILGHEAASRVEYFDHDCYDKENHVYLGASSFGTHAWVNRQVREANKVIITGGIVYHYFAGFGGGRKSILPGISSYDTIQANHKLLFNPEPGSGKNRRATTGILNGNPIHEDMVELGQMFSPNFMLNVVANDKDEIAALFAGHWLSAHLAGCQFVEEKFSLPISELADLVIVSAGGHPKDINYYQGHKALDNADRAVKPGGVVILLAECKEKIGYPAYWYEFNSLAQLEETLRDRFEIVGHNAYVTIEKAKKEDVILVSALEPDQVRKMHMIPANSGEQALEMALKKLGKKPKTYIMPEGYVTFPKLVRS